MSQLNLWKLVNIQYGTFIHMNNTVCKQGNQNF